MRRPGLHLIHHLTHLLVAAPSGGREYDIIVAVAPLDLPPVWFFSIFNRVPFGWHGIFLDVALHGSAWRFPCRSSPTDVASAVVPGRVHLCFFNYGEIRALGFGNIGLFPARGKNPSVEPWSTAYMSTRRSLISASRGTGRISVTRAWAIVCVFWACLILGRNPVPLINLILINLILKYKTFQKYCAI